MRGGCGQEMKDGGGDGRGEGREGEWEPEGSRGEGGRRGVWRIGGKGGRGGRREGGEGDGE